jgi:hypothetical protein
MVRSILTALAVLALAAGGAVAAGPPAAAQLTVDVPGAAPATVSIAGSLVGFSRGGQIAYAYQHNQTDLEFLRSWRDSGRRRDATLVLFGADGRPTATFSLRSAWPSSFVALSPQGPGSDGVVEISYESVEVLSPERR